VGNRPIFLLPPPELRLIKDPAFLALDAALYKVILYIAERYFLREPRLFSNAYKPRKKKREGLKGNQDYSATLTNLVRKKGRD